MPHRNITDIHRLEESVQLLQTTNGKHIILAGDFNCPDINWENMTVKNGAADREVQQALLDLSTEHGLTQVHNQPTRDNNMLDLVFTNNSSLVKTSTSVPGISDHAMIVTDMDILPQFIRQKPRKFFIFSKATGMVSATTWTASLRRSPMQSPRQSMDFGHSWRQALEGEIGFP